MYSYSYSYCRSSTSLYVDLPRDQKHDTKNRSQSAPSFPRETCQMCRCLLSNVSEANMRSHSDSWGYIYPSHQLPPLPPHREKKKKGCSSVQYSTVQHSTVPVIIKLESKLVGIKAPYFTISAPPYPGSGQVFTQGMCQPTRLLCSKLRLLYSKSRRR